MRPDTRSEISARLHAIEADARDALSTIAHQCPDTQTVEVKLLTIIAHANDAIAYVHRSWGEAE